MVVHEPGCLGGHRGDCAVSGLSFVGTWERHVEIYGHDVKRTVKGTWFCRDCLAEGTCAPASDGYTLAASSADMTPAQITRVMHAAAVAHAKIMDIEAGLDPDDSDWVVVEEEGEGATGGEG